MGEGNISSAITEFEEALRLHSDFPEAEENLRMAKASGGDSLMLHSDKISCLSWASPTNAVATGLWPVCVGLPFHNISTAHRAVATVAAMLKRLTITVADVISNHRIDRLESVRGADETVLG